MDYPSSPPFDQNDDWDAEESAADELPSDFDEPDDDVGAERPPRRVASLPGESLYNRGVYFLLHRPGRYHNRMPSAARAISESAPDLNLVLSLGLPRIGTIKAQEYFEAFPGRTCAWRIADPEGYAMPGDLIGEPPLTTMQRTKVGYVNGVLHPGEPTPHDWNHQVINSQRAAGANILLTPGRSLDPGNPEAALAGAVNELDDLLANVAEGEYAAWNLSMDSTWLTDQRLRNQLLAELVDHEEVSTWHIRVRWPLIRRTYGQTLSRPLLMAYQELANLASRENKVLLLPNSGPTGWLTLAWGASGFGAGSSSASQAWAITPRIAARPDTPRSTVQRVFSVPLLHTITDRSHQALENGLLPAVYPRCDCEYCLEQAVSDVWRPELAAQHAAYSYGMLAAAVARSTDRRAFVSMVAETAWERTHVIPPGLQLEAAETPEHLDVWSGIFEWES
ncbi:MAG: hypothetical protein QM747_18295 [Nocardioides sp.]